MRKIGMVVALVVSGCAHAGIRNVSDCKEVEGEKRIECGACTAQNEAQGWLGTYEYRKDAESGKRCVRVK
jgi:metal-dependent hydrolase (beta-lactamase superfamily II)